MFPVSDGAAVVVANDAAAVDNDDDDDGTSSIETTKGIDGGCTATAAASPILPLTVPLTVPLREE